MSRAAWREPGVSLVRHLIPFDPNPGAGRAPLQDRAGPKEPRAACIERSAPGVLRPCALILLATALAVFAATSIAAAPTRSRAATASPERVTVIGDSIATGIAYNTDARAILARGIDLDLELAVCRRLVGDSCPYEGTRPPTLVDLLPTLTLGRTVVVAVGYNDFEATFDDSVEAALQALERAGVAHVLWLTLRAERQSYLHMNEIVRAAATRHPEMQVVDWNLYSRSHPDWFQPDGLHLTNLGANAMATLIHEALDDLGLVTHPVPTAPTIATRMLRPARAGEPYAFRLAARGGVLPIRWMRASGSLPKGVALTSGGLLKGTPQVAGRRLITLRVTDARGRSTTRRLALTVRPSA